MGTFWLGRYCLLERLGAGGFGVVWRARDETHGREVAIKRIALDPGGDPDRAAREAMAVGRLAHPSIVRLHEARFGEDGFYLVSELVCGPTLGRLFERSPPHVGHLLKIIRSVAQALVHAHAHGVIHRDVKPHNILVPDQPAPGDSPAKLTDFGGAQLIGEEGLTRTGDVVGTLAYMAPEQADGRGAGPAADLYALALVLYEGLTGVNPVRGAGPADTARRLGRPLPPLGPRRPDLSPRLVRAIDMALDPRPAHRGHLEDLIDALTAEYDQAPRVRGGPSRARLPGRSGRLLPGVAVPQPTPQTPVEHRGGGPPLARAPRLAGALAAGLLMTATLRMLLVNPSYAPAGGALCALAVAIAPRLGWLAGAAFVVIWLCVTNAAGAGLIVTCAVLPVALSLRRAGPAWSASALAPLAGLVGVAAVFPAVAAQAGGWPRRAAVGATGFWWLMLAQPLADRRLWLGPPRGTVSRVAFEHTLSGALDHALVPLLVPATLAGAGLWALGAACLPWIVRGRHATHDMVGALAWALALAVGATLLERGLSPAGTAPWPSGLALGTVAAAAAAVAGAALRPARAPLASLRSPMSGRHAGEGEVPV